MKAKNGAIHINYGLEQYPTTSIADKAKFGTLHL
jgi:hypothetical protein